MVRRRVAETVCCLAVDLGASNVASSSEDTTAKESPSRKPIDSPTDPSRRGTLYWDFDALMREILAGLRKGVEFARQSGDRVRSIGIDSWGVDFGLLDKNGRLVTPPVTTATNAPTAS